MECTEHKTVPRKCPAIGLLISVLPFAIVTMMLYLCVHNYVHLFSRLLTQLTNPKNHIIKLILNLDKVSAALLIYSGNRGKNIKIPHH